MTPAVTCNELGKRYGSRWALQQCTLEIPQGSVTALVGPNGAGKTTLLQLAIGLTAPTTGSVDVLGWSARTQPLVVLARTGFVAQDRPLYKGFRVSEMLEAGRRLNARWEGERAVERLRGLEIPLDQRVDRLSGGQQAQVALALALAKRPELLLLDEPVASLDPLARREFLEVLMATVAEEGFTVVLSSHVLADLERVCDHLVLLDRSRVRLSGEIEGLLSTHRLLVGPPSAAAALDGLHHIVQARHTGRQSSVVVKVNGSVWDPSWESHELSLEDLVLAYMRSSAPEKAAEAAEAVPA